MTFQSKNPVARMFRWVGDLPAGLLEVSLFDWLYFGASLNIVAHFFCGTIGEASDNIVMAAILITIAEIRRLGSRIDRHKPSRRKPLHEDFDRFGGGR